MDYEPYASYTAFFLVIEGGEFRLGANVRAFWSWTSNAGSDGAVNKLCCGNIDRVEVQDKPTTSNTYGIFYDLYYPFDIIVGDNTNTLNLIMYEHAKSSSNCHRVARLCVRRVYTARTKAPDYDASRALPIIRFYYPGYWNNALFDIIVPDSLANDRPI